MTGKYRSAATGVVLMAMVTGSATSASAQEAAPEAPEITAISCAAAPTGTCRRGDVVEITGSDLDRVTRVLFLGSRGPKDNRKARVTTATATRLTAVVPSKAKSGRLLVFASAGLRSRTTVPLRIAGRAPKPALPPTAIKLPAGKVFLDGPPARYTFRGAPGAQAVVELYDATSSSVLASWPATVGPDGTGVSQWDGMLAGKPAPVGRYGFRVAGAATSRSADAPGEFDLLDHIFPIRAKHDLGRSETNNFGGGRNHGGQDLFARCGAPLVAARGGVVTRAAFQARAGNYVVITAADGVSYVYMHLRKPALVATKAKVLTGQQIGEVGDTGRASGCHLHFELWSAPGWYMGGSAFDPLPELTRWDAQS